MIRSYQALTIESWVLAPALRMFRSGLQVPAPEPHAQAPALWASRSESWVLAPAHANPVSWALRLDLCETTPGTYAPALRGLKVGLMDTSARAVRVRGRRVDLKNKLMGTIPSPELCAYAPTSLALSIYLWVPAPALRALKPDSGGSVQHTSSLL